MTENTRGTNPFDPTDERTADESTPGASGLDSGQTDDVVNKRRPEPPRRDDTERERNPTLPTNDSTLRTEI
ncbi:MAG TPA: hypothetical protein VF147_07350 [Vicinamibacterales bacterium]